MSSPAILPDWKCDEGRRQYARSEGTSDLDSLIAGSTSLVLKVLSLQPITLLADAIVALLCSSRVSSWNTIIPRSLTHLHLLMVRLDRLLCLICVLISTCLPYRRQWNFLSVHHCYFKWPLEDLVNVYLEILDVFDGGDCHVNFRLVWEGRYVPSAAGAFLTSIRHVSEEEEQGASILLNTTLPSDTQALCLAEFTITFLERLYTYLRPTDLPACYSF